MKELHWKYVALGILLLEAASFATYTRPLWSALFLACIVSMAAYAVWKDRRYAPVLLITELILGSKGYLFFADIAGQRISLRIAFFCVILAVWFFRTPCRSLFAERSAFERKYILPAWAAVLLAIVYATVRGITAGYPAADVFLDMNGYLYLAALPLFLDTLRSFPDFARLLRWATVAIVIVTVKTLLILYLFTHGTFFAPILPYAYKWIRDTGVGEITWAGGGFWRIFFQSHIAQLLALPVTALVLGYEAATHGRNYFSQRHVWLLAGIASLASSSVWISFSRSFWIGLVGCMSVVLVLIIALFRSWAVAWRSMGVWSAGLLTGVALLFCAAYFPLPTPEGAFGLDLLRDRFTMISGEAAVSSRWNLLQPLLNRIQEHRVLGSGFGTLVTFQTEDPRIKNSGNPEGWHTTYTFEWGYLDTLTEGGALFLATLIFLWGAIAAGLISTLRTAAIGGASIAAGLAGGVVVLCVVHAFTPYLNHPLGIGFMLIAAAAGRALYRRTEGELLFAAITKIEINA